MKTTPRIISNISKLNCMLLGHNEGKGKNLAKTGKKGKLLLIGTTIGMERDR